MLLSKLESKGNLRHGDFIEEAHLRDGQLISGITAIDFDCHNQKIDEEFTVSSRGVPDLPNSAFIGSRGHVNALVEEGMSRETRYVEITVGFQYPQNIERERDLCVFKLL